MKTVLQKLSSRKLWTALAGIAAGLALAFGLDQEAVASTAGGCGVGGIGGDVHRHRGPH